MNAALLLGNGLNRLAAEQMDFESVVKGLFPNRVPGHKIQSPLPLEFELAYSDRNANSTNGERYSKYELKKEIQKMITDKHFSEDALSLTRDFTSLPVKHIMTTNYDYNLEKSINPPFDQPPFDRKKSPGKTKEKLCSLYRSLMPDYHSLQDAKKVIWHIHGEAAAPESICLGFEHYCAQLAAMRQFLTKPYQDGEPPYLNYFLESGGLEPVSWLTLFFTHNIYIIGLSLSFIEIDLWWLLTYRYQYQLRHPKAPRNKIVYFHRPEIDAEEIRLMPALGVETKELEATADDWLMFYRLALAVTQKAIK